MKTNYAKFLKYLMLFSAAALLLVSCGDGGGGTSTAQPSMSGLTQDEQTSIDSVCSEAKYLKGPVAYNECISKQLASLKGTSRNVDMSGLTQDEQTSIESVCSEAKYLRGPVAYNQCISKQLASLKAPLRH
jgi:hypothetical protein